ncbi:MAG TPA: T9SS type A sorting domain-containing protein [Ignavibacteriaceae bacterium]|nr:T9SS type A sorting domain-containing protein [Ignavibacteriaceae bacterium]
MKTFLILFIILVVTGNLHTQTAKIDTYGMSPNQVDADSTDIFNLPYNGLKNVGANTQMYLEVSLRGAALTNPSWHVIAKPVDSNPVFGSSTNLNDSNQVIIFVPDSTGTYKIDFSDGSITSDTLVITVGLYLGYQGGEFPCGSCHADKVDEWQQTGHYSIFEEGLNGTLSNHYGPGCIKCHTTGYDANADNNGFDDFPFVFPDSLYPGVYDQMVAQYPQAMQRGRIQCESCHGPGSEHNYGAANVMAVTLAAENCAWCHDGGHHVFPSQWRVSAHATFEHGMTNASCAQCHNGAGFVEYIESGKQPITQNLSKVVPITCAVCHDPHSVQYPHQLRTMDVTLSDGEAVTGGGNGTICMNCHKAREDAVEYTNDYLNNLSTHYGPHHGPQADILSAKNAVTFGQNITSSPHLAATGDACVTCHMYPGTVDDYGNIILVGSHSFRMSQDTTDNVAACAPCHGDIGTKFSDKKFYVNGNADLDGDGVANGLQIEIQGLLNQLKARLPQVNGVVTINDSSVTLVQAQAAYDYLMVNEDRSLGIHNPAFVYGLLKASIEALGGVVAAGNDNNDLPHDFMLSQNYPNPFNPTTSIQYEVPAGSNVKIIVYDALGKQVAVLVDEYKDAGRYSIGFNGANLASGIYFCRMEAGNFTKVNKMLLLK